MTWVNTRAEQSMGVDKKIFKMAAKRYVEDESFEASETWVHNTAVECGINFGTPEVTFYSVNVG